MLELNSQERYPAPLMLSGLSGGRVYSAVWRGTWSPWNNPFCSTERQAVAQSSHLQFIHRPSSASPLQDIHRGCGGAPPISCLWPKAPGPITVSWSRKEQTVEGGCPLLWKPRPEPSTLQLLGTWQMCSLSPKSPDILLPSRCTHTHSATSMPLVH
jgi:hypothetical protein